MSVEPAGKTSAWPVFVAVGLAVGEVGVIANRSAVAVAGLLLFAGSVAGVVRDAGYVDRPWGLLAGLGVALTVLGMVLVATQVPPTVAGWTTAPSSPEANVRRGVAVALAGGLAVLAGGVGQFLEASD